MTEMVLEAVNVAVATITTIATAIPVVGTVVSVAKTCKQIYDITTAASRTSKKNKENCKKISKRCHALLSILTECAQAYQRNGKISKGQEDGLNDLAEALEDLHKACEKYIGLGKVRRLWGAKKFKKKYESIDSEIVEAMKLVQTGLSIEILNSNNKVLEDTKFIVEIHDKLNEMDNTIKKSFETIETRLEKAWNGNETNFNELKNMLQEIQDNNQISPDGSNKLVDILGNLDELNNNFNLKSRKTKRTLFHIQDVLDELKEKHDNNEFLTIVTEGFNDLKKGQRNIESKLDDVGIAFQMMNEQIKQLENGQTNAIKQVMNNLNNLQNNGHNNISPHSLNQMSEMLNSLQNFNNKFDLKDQNDQRTLKHIKEVLENLENSHRDGEFLQALQEGFNDIKDGQNDLKEGQKNIDDKLDRIQEQMERKMKEMEEQMKQQMLDKNEKRLKEKDKEEEEERKRKKREKKEEEGEEKRKRKKKEEEGEKRRLEAERKRQESLEDEEEEEEEGEEVVVNNIKKSAACIKWEKEFDGKTEVDLDDKNLTDEDALAIGELLKTNNTLSSLNLENNNITDVQSIGEGLKTNNTLKTLWLGNNNITDVQSIGEGLKTNNTLEYLLLDNNNITDDGGIQSIIDGLKINQTLKYLYLADNQLSDNMKSQLNAIKQYKRDGSNGYQQVEGMTIFTGDDY